MGSVIAVKTTLPPITTALFGQIFSKSCSFSPEIVFLPLILVSNCHFLEECTYIAQKESRFPKRRVSSRCNDVTTVTNTFSFGIFSTIYYKDRYNMLYRDIFLYLLQLSRRYGVIKMQPSGNLLSFYAVSRNAYGTS